MAKTSPFDAVHRQLGARFGEFDGWTLPADFGDTAVEADALRGHCAVVDLSSFGRLSLKGGGAAAFAGSLLDKGKLFDGRWKWATLNAAGMHLPCRVGRLNGEAFVFTPPGTAEGAADAMEKVIDAQNADVSVTNLTDKTAMLGLYGPTAIDSVNRAITA